LPNLARPTGNIQSPARLFILKREQGMQPEKARYMVDTLARLPKKPDAARMLSSRYAEDIKRRRGAARLHRY